MRESHPHHFHRHHHHHHSTQTSCPGRRLTRRGSWWPWTTTRTRARARELSRLETPNITICNATVDHSDTKPFFIHYFLLCEGDLAWRLCSREVKASRTVPPWWLRTSATINIRPNTIQVSYTLFCGEDNFRNRYRTKVSERDVLIDFWDTAGQERFNTMHRSYYHQAHACIMVFDATRKVTVFLDALASPDFKLSVSVICFSDNQW